MRAFSMAVQSSGCGCSSTHLHFAGAPDAAGTRRGLFLIENGAAQNPANRGTTDLEPAGNLGFADAGAVQFSGLPQYVLLRLPARASRFPFSRACARPARVRSRRTSRSNSEKIASSPAVARPAGLSDPALPSTRRTRHRGVPAPEGLPEDPLTTGPSDPVATLAGRGKTPCASFPVTFCCRLRRFGAAR